MEKHESCPMKTTATTATAATIAASVAAILATTTIAWAEPSPATLTYSQLAKVVQHADADLNAVPGFVGANLKFDLRPIPKQPYFAAAIDPHGIAFTCQKDFVDFAGGPVAATLVSYERGADGRDHVKLDGCTAQER